MQRNDLMNYNSYLKIATIAFLIAAHAATKVQANQVGTRVPSVIRDIELSQDVEILGQFVDHAGIGQSGRTIIVRGNDGMIAQAITDDAGNFRVAVQRGGVYLIRVGDAKCVVRAWMHKTSPPVAAKGALLVERSGISRLPSVGDPQVVRGQAAAAAGGWSSAATMAAAVGAATATGFVVMEMMAAS